MLPEAHRSGCEKILFAWSIDYRTTYAMKCVICSPKSLAWLDGLKVSHNDAALAMDANSRIFIGDGESTAETVTMLEEVTSVRHAPTLAA
jgi:hypothetical protein